MTASEDTVTEELLRRVERADRNALEELLARQRERLRRLVAVRMDRRLRARIDPSDIVQETLAVAVRRLPEYLRCRPVPFYPWLRKIAWERLVELHRKHVQARRRSVTREEPLNMRLPEESAFELADRLVAPGSSPSGRMMREELRQRVRAALEQLPPQDREVVVMRHLEQLKVNEIAAVLGLTEAAVQSRYRRAAERLHRLLSE